MDKIEAVYNMQSYIEKHYLEEINMSSLSKVSYYSPWYSYRIFLEYTSLSISDYVRRYRLSRSALELRDTNAKIIDIAYKYCYDSVDGYQRAFLKSINDEPVCLWLPKAYIKTNTSTYVQGVEVDIDYKGVIPEGFDVIELPECKYLMFQGEKFQEEDFEEAIYELKDAINKYDPSTIGHSYDVDNPRIQLEPIGERGYIELLPIK